MLAVFRAALSPTVAERRAVFLALNFIGIITRTVERSKLRAWIGRRQTTIFQRITHRLSVENQQKNDEKYHKTSKEQPPNN